MRNIYENIKLEEFKLEASHSQKKLCITSKLNAQNLLQDEIRSCEALHELFVKETEDRLAELKLLQEIRKIVVERVASIKDYIISNLHTQAKHSNDY